MYNIQVKIPDFGEITISLIVNLLKQAGYFYSQDGQPVAELQAWQTSIEDDRDPLHCVHKDRAQGKEAIAEAETQLRNNSVNTKKKKFKEAEEKMTGKAKQKVVVTKGLQH